MEACLSGGMRAPLGTIEFFPEEGKYHFDGHRACGIVWDPPTTRAHNVICPVCGKPVTVGVMHRVEALADRPEGFRPAGSRPFHSLIPLPEVLGEVYGVGASSKQVQAEYMKLLARLGPELLILRETLLEEIAAVGGERLAEGIGRMRRGEVIAQPGYDGEFGVIRVFGAARVSEAQMGLFGETDEGRKTKDEESRAGVRNQESGGRGQGSGDRSRQELESRETGEQESRGATPTLFVTETPMPYASTDEGIDAARTAHYGITPYGLRRRPQRGTTRRRPLHRCAARDRGGPGHGQDAHADRPYRGSDPGEASRAGEHPGDHLHQQGRGGDAGAVERVVGR